MASSSNVPSSSPIFGDLNVQDYLAIARRRKFWIIFSALAVLVTTAVVAWRLPNTYRCETTILVDPQKVPENYIHAATTENIADRLSTILQMVTSPAQLKKLIDTMGLYPDLRKRVSEQEIIRTMQQSIGVEPVTAMGAQLSAFRITFKGKNPVEVAQVANQIAAMFIEENLKAREQQSYGTADFLESELQKTSQALQTKETELAEIRSRYIQDLPESEQFHVQESENLRMQLRGVEEHISRDQQEKVYLQSLMATSTPTVDLDLASGSSAYSSQLDSLQTKLATLQTRYGPAHPDVRRVQAQIDELKAKEVTAPAAGIPAGTNPTPKTLPPSSTRKNYNPVVESQIEKLNQDIEDQKKRTQELQTEINFHVSKIERVPIFQQKTAGITRDYDSLKARYTQLLDKKLAADTASAMETRQKSERFVILDPAQVPDKPYSPNRPLLLALGIIGGTLIGIGVAAAMELTDVSVRDSREVERILSKPVLTGVPEIMTAQQQWNGRLRACIVGTSMVVAAAALGLGIVQLSVHLF
jgi:polysaccharide chain length determinant protein (PEP-CTERM system associated)